MDAHEAESYPKAVLHDHLDGGLRVATVIEIADAIGHNLPSTEESELADWFHQGHSGSLERYLGAFEHSLAVMQTQDSIKRIAGEAVEDLAADGVVYAELRFDPGLCTRGGLTREDVLEAATDGIAGARKDSGITVYTIVSALRHLDDSEHAASAAIRFQGEGVVAFDLAGPEIGHPPDGHLAAIRSVRESGLGLTLHAGEGDGAHSIWRALALCSAQRIGHGVHIADETHIESGRITVLSSFARSVRDHRVPLEVAITSNLHTASYGTAAEHPFGALYRAGFNVSLNTDDRLMSGVTTSGEYALAADTFGLNVEDLGAITIAAVEAGFGPWPERKRIIDDVVAPAYGLSRCPSSGGGASSGGAGRSNP
jgi:adenosine deaminase